MKKLIIQIVTIVFGINTLSATGFAASQTPTNLWNQYKIATAEAETTRGQIERTKILIATLKALDLQYAQANKSAEIRSLLLAQDRLDIVKNLQINISSEQEAPARLEELNTQLRNLQSKISQLKANLVLTDKRFDITADILARKLALERKLTDITQMRKKIGEATTKREELDGQIFLPFLFTGLLIFPQTFIAIITEMKRTTNFLLSIMAISALYIGKSMYESGQLKNFIQETLSKTQAKEKEYNAELQQLEEIFNEYEGRLRLN